MSNKQQKRQLTVEEKLEIIKRMSRGEKMGDLADAFSVARSTIHDTYKKRAIIQEYSKAKIFGLTKRQSLRRGKYPRLEEALYEWYLQEKKTGIHINSAILLERAKEIHKELFNTDEGVPTGTGWLAGFKRRYKVLFSQQDDIPLDNYNSGEPSPNEELDEFKNIFFAKIVGLELCPSQVYVATETKLCWKILPGNDYDRKFGKDNIRFISCANASGLHKLKLLVIGNSDTAHHLENVNLPVHYFKQKILRITEELFKTWFDECFIAETRNWLTEHNLPPKALLIVDQSLCHSEDYGNEDFTTLLYPPELKNMMPLNENALKTVKQNYKRHLLRTMSSRDLPMEESLNQFNIRDMVFTLSQIWQSFDASTISLTWKRVWDNMMLDIENTIDDDIAKQFDLTLLRNIAENMLFPMEQLKKWFDGHDERVDKHEVFYSSPDGNMASPTTQISLKDAVNSFDNCIQWAEQNGLTSEEIALLRKIRDKALISKQTTFETELVEDGYSVPIDHLSSLT